MKTFKRTSLPEQIVYNNKVYRYGSKTEKSIKVEVLSRRLKKSLDLYGNYYKPTEHYFNPIEQLPVGMSYREFLFSMLFLLHVEKIGSCDDMAYDRMFPEAVKHLQLFSGSMYDVGSSSEYDCILNYLRYEVK